MTNLIISNQSQQNTSQLLKLVLAWLDEDSFEDLRALESSLEFHQVRSFLKSISSWFPNNTAELLSILEKYPHASQVIDVMSLLTSVKTVCFCSRSTPQILIKYS